MNRTEFLQALSRELAQVPAEERDAAIEYYNEYFDDAGAENEQTVIAELGTAEKVAEKIKANCGNIPSPLRTAQEVKNHVVNNSVPPKNTSRTVLMVILLILTFPLWVGVVAAAFGILVSLLVIFAAVFIVGIALVASGIAVCFGGVVLTGVNLAGGFVTIGAGLVVAAIGILMTAGMILVFGKGVPFIGKNIGHLFQSIFRRRNAE